jgi:hypothetical protein
MDIAALSAQLDALDGAARCAQLMALTARQQAELFEAAHGHQPLTLEFLVPPATPAMTGVPHEGKNSLWLFTRFAKVFYRPEQEQQELWGYNEGTQLVKTTVGPGYFVCTPHSEPGELLIDYTRRPGLPLPGAPRILDNASRLSFFVFNQTKDVLRGVSKHVSIGRAMRRDRWLDNWFVLVRAERSMR